jgi:flagella basal body P-ring formation protein FlgA
MRYSCFILALCWAVPLAAQSMEPCLPLSGNEITGRDMVRAVPELAGVAESITLGFSPMPGVERIFSVSELQRLATRFRIETKILQPVCFAWPVHSLTKEEISQALLQSLAGRDVELEITDQCHTPVPAGSVTFPLEGLTAQTSRTALWNGYVTYGVGRHFSTWVQVKVTVREPQIVTARPIRSGEILTASDLKSTIYSGPLRRSSVIHESTEAAGKCALRPIDAGTVLAQTMLGLPHDVDSQQLVTVQIHCGAAYIETQAIAVEAGHLGDVIKVRNPKSGRVFRGQINAPGVVTVVPGGEVGLVGGDKKPS